MSKRARASKENNEQQPSILEEICSLDTVKFGLPHQFMKLAAQTKKGSSSMEEGGTGHSKSPHEQEKEKRKLPKNSMSMSLTFLFLASL